MHTIEAGGLTFQIENRTLGKDGGPALLVFGDVDGERVQILRFDCFHEAPHYHYDPTGKNQVHRLEQGADNIRWAVDQVRAHVDEMIRTAGYDDIADQTDMTAVETMADQIEQALRTEPETA
jgi:hypothetical protein